MCYAHGDGCIRAQSLLGTRPGVPLYLRINQHIAVKQKLLTSTAPGDFVSVTA